MSDLPQKPDNYTGWFEPRSAANSETAPEYRYNQTWESLRGHSIELDDTPDRERIRIQHRANTFIEIAPNGDGTFKIFGDGYNITMGDYNVSVGVDDGKNAHKMNITVYGDVNMRVTGDKTETIEGSFTQHIKGHYNQIVEKSSTIQSNGELTIGGGAGAGGTVSIQAGDSLFLDCDLTVNGELTAKKILSKSRVDAMTGMNAGPDGFVTTLGGVSAGFPLAVPGTIMAAVNMVAGASVTAGASMTAPIATFGTMDAMLMTDEFNTMVFDTHNHIAPFGPTSTPLSKML